MTIYVWGTDPGFANFGVTVWRLLPDAEDLVYATVIKTRPEKKKGNVLKSDDHHRRNKIITGALVGIFGNWLPVAVAAESVSLPRNSSSSYMIGRGWGALSTLLVTNGDIPLTQASPQAIKKRVCGKGTASKKEVQEAIERRYPGQFDAFKADVPKGDWEHVFDGAGAMVTSLDSEVFKMARQMAARG
jgi:Holliday junction resolvasome RuvABC endonuclease subunit